jgi:dehydrogenase/reductase SDR family member 9
MQSSAIGVMGWIGWSCIGLVILSRIWKYFRRLKMLSLADRWIVVTGCDSGIGAGLVEKLVAAKASVIAFTYTEKGAKAALNAGAKLAPCLDITDEAAVRKASVEVKDICGGRLWGIVHNAGAVQPGFIEFQPLENYRKMMAVNFYGVVDLTQQLIPSVKAASGRIVVVTSVDGIVSLPSNAPYDAAKFATEAYADALRVELSFWNISVSVINPSTMRTPLAMNFAESERDTWDAMDRLDPDGPWKQAWTREWLDEHITKNIENLERIVQDPKHTINDIFHAVSAKRPKMRYLSGTLAKTLIYALWVMPEHWSFAFKKLLIQPPPNTTPPDVK